MPDAPVSDDAAAEDTLDGCGADFLAEPATPDAELPPASGRVASDG